MQSEIIAVIQSILRKVLSNKNLIISENTSAKDIEGWDSLTHLDIITEIETFFKIKFSFDEVLSFHQIGDMVKCIAKKTTNN